MDVKSEENNWTGRSFRWVNIQEVITINLQHDGPVSKVCSGIVKPKGNLLLMSK